jgi:sugar phosphate isomerase/epimerase
VAARHGGGPQLRAHAAGAKSRGLAREALGTGDVGMEAYLTTLKEIGYDGPLTIEREIPEDPVRQKADIGSAVALLE